MALKKLGIAALCVALFAGSFAAGISFLQPASRADRPQIIPRPAKPDQAGAKSSADGKEARQEAAPAFNPEPSNPVTRADVSDLGHHCIGRRVSWVGHWVLSQSTRIGNREGSQHILKGQGPQGGFSFDFVFVAEDPNPLDRERIRRHLQEVYERAVLERRLKRPVPKVVAKIVTVTGTITRLDTLILIGEGTHYDVPVLTDIEITDNP